MDEILVSINCITFNHEKYIIDAIEGFLMQKTNFKYEILIHDDASTDGTAEIIKKYEARYPELIKPIYQKENQYSKGIKRIDHIFNSTRARGKYIALCEGDDYWTDPYKLQKQIAYMESNQDCTLSFHAAEIVKSDRKTTEKLLGRFDTGNKIYNAGQLIELGFIPTASFIYRRDVMDSPPEWYIKAVVGDLPMTLICTHRGYACYFDEVMSAYRTGVAGSLMDIWDNKYSAEEKIKLHRGYIDIFNSFNQYSKNKYSKQIEQVIKEREFEILVLEGSIKKIKDEKYRAIYLKQSFIRKVKIICRCNFPKLYRRLALIRHRQKIWAVE